MKGTRVDVTNDSRPVTPRAGNVGSLVEGRAQPLPRELHKPKPRNLTHLNAGPIVMKGFAKPLFNISLSLVGFHVDEINNNKPAKVTKPKLSSDLFSGLEVGPQGGFFNVGATGGSGRVHIHRNERLGMVNDQGPTRWQFNHT